MVPRGPPVTGRPRERIQATYSFQGYRTALHTLGLQKDHDQPRPGAEGHPNTCGAPIFPSHHARGDHQVKATGAPLPDIVVVVGPGMWQAGLAESRMGKGKVILKREFTHDRTCGLNTSEFPATLVRIVDRARCPTRASAPKSISWSWISAIAASLGSSIRQVQAVRLARLPDGGALNRRLAEFAHAASTAWRTAGENFHITSAVAAR